MKSALRQVVRVWMGLVLGFPMLAWASAGAPIWDEPTGAAKFLGIKRPTEGLRVVWWNIMHGQLAETLPATPLARNALEHNLLSFALEADAPHVLVLGEYEPRTLSAHTQSILFKKYRYQDYVPYNSETPNRGVLFLSQLPVAAGEPKTLDWAPSSWNASEQSFYRAFWASRNATEALYFTRTYRRYDVTFWGQVFSVVPIHLLQPWSEIQRNDTVVHAVYDILFDEKNPLIYQLQYLLGYLEQEHARKTVVIGDFNMPERILLRSKGYEQFRERWIDAFDGRHEMTFPAASADERARFPYTVMGLTIDHLFVSSRVQVADAQVLPLRGSDHYAIYTVVK